MLGIVVIFLLAIYLVFFFPIAKKDKKEKQVSDKTAMQVKKLWKIALDAMHDRKTLRAEKALLAILRVDEKNAAAYNRLGILYAKSKKYAEAIECFEIAQSLDENASSLHNAGLIYLETGEYEKAAMAFRQAIDLEGDVPTRYVALAKAEEKLGSRKNAIEALEQAYALDPSINILRQILAIHKAAGDEEGIAATNARIEAEIAKNERNKKRQLGKRPLGKPSLRRPAMRRPTPNKPITRINKKSI